MIPSLNFTNHYLVGIRNFMIEALGNDFVKHEETINKIAASIKTDKEYTEIASMLAEVYSAAYTKCVEEHREVLKQAGYNVNVVAREKKDTIF